MAIPNITEESIIQALAYIDENGVPDKNKSTKYELVAENGKKYPPKYVIAVADHIANGTEIVTDGYNAVEAKNYLSNKGFYVEMRQDRFELVITANNVTSTDGRFSMDNIGLGDGYKPLATYYKRASGEVVYRNRNKHERKIANQTMPRLACQVFESQLTSLSAAEKENFPTCRYSLAGEIYRGIFPSVAEFRKRRNTIEYMTYTCEDGSLFVIYCWNIFSTILFVQECLTRFGATGDSFVLTYCEKEEKEKEVEEASMAALADEQFAQRAESYSNPYSRMLLESKNIIFRGAPGTGKSYLAKEIAADIVSGGTEHEYTKLSAEQKQQIEFVQFHPSYDYSDFVEGLRPKKNIDGSMGFELRDGVFKSFVDRARRNCENAKKSKEALQKESVAKKAIAAFLTDIEFGSTKFQTVTGNEFVITDVDDVNIQISIPGNAAANTLNICISEIQQMLESGEQFEKVKDLTQFFGKTFASQAYSYNFAIYKEIISRGVTPISVESHQEELKKFVFIIDEINRGEISKILGELFFAIDPGYRGEAGSISTQYANLHDDPNEKFYIPENVYIIGTMNDIDRSVDSFDFAMRRRFRFVEIKADERLEMLNALGNESLKEEAEKRMSALNNAILAVKDLNENYQIGAAYFLKLNTLSFDQLWADYLKPLLQEYVHGMYDAESTMKAFEKAYRNEGHNDEAGQD